MDKVVNEVPDWDTSPDSVATDPSACVVVHVEVNSVSTGFSNVVKVVNEVPDWDTSPDSVATDPSACVVVHVEVNSV